MLADEDELLVSQGCQDLYFLQLNSVFIYILYILLSDCTELTSQKSVDSQSEIV